MDYDRIRATSLRMLDGAKQGAVTLTREIPGTANPAAPWEPVQRVTQTEGLAAVVKGVSQQFVDGSTVLASDLEVLTAPPAMGVQVADRVMVDGRPVTVLRITPIPAAGDPAVLRLIVRG